MRRAWPLLVMVLVVGVVFVGVFPSKTYLTQRSELDAVEDRLDVLTRENQRLAERARLLRTDAEIERLARSEYKLVRPGEEAYAILPSPPSITPSPPSTTTSTTTRPPAPTGR